MSILHILIILLVIFTVAVAFVPQLSGLRTKIAARLTIVWGAILPLLSDWLPILKAADWRTMINPQLAPWIILGLALLFEFLRRITTGPPK